MEMVHLNCKTFKSLRQFLCTLLLLFSCMCLLYFVFNNIILLLKQFAVFSLCVVTNVIEIMYRTVWVHGTMSNAMINPYRYHKIHLTIKKKEYYTTISQSIPRMIILLYYRWYNSTINSTVHRKQNNLSIQQGFQLYCKFKNNYYSYCCLLVDLASPTEDHQ